MADGVGDFPSLSSLRSSNLSGSDGYLSLGEDDPEFVNEADRLRFQCPVHKGLLRNTRQTCCGHRLCHECVVLWLNGETSKRCPVGESDCEDVTEGNVNVDRSIVRDMRNVPVYCKNKLEGCPLKILFKNYRSHLDDCEFQRVPCECGPRGCKEVVLRGKVKEHQEKCPFRPVRCQLCHMEVNHNQMKDHDANDCGEKVTGCPFGCDNKTLKRKEVTDHRDVCPVHPVDCTFKAIGCKYVGQRELMDKHEKEGLAQHLELVVLYVTKLQASSQDTQERLRTLSAEREELHQSLQSASSRNTAASEKIQGQENQVKDLKLRLVGMLERVILLERKIPDLVEQPRMNTLEQSVNDIQRKITQLEQRRDDQQRGGTGGTGGSGLGGNTPVAHYGTLDNFAETAFNHLRQHSTQLEVVDVRMAEMDLRFQLLETASYDGFLIWKIKDYERRKRDAVSGRTLSLYSQPFYSHRFGYKMCARVYLNGDGIGKTSHLSLFFVIMRGDYDPLLVWPFRQKVTLTLLDQSSERRHLTDSFIPDLNSTSFRRPTTEMNVATGCPMFVSHAVLENENNSYLKEDTIFIRIVVDSTHNPNASIF